MAKEYMVGTVDDKPLLKVVLAGVTYFYDPDNGYVFADEPGLPRVTDKELLKTIKEQAT